MSEPSYEADLSVSLHGLYIGSRDGHAFSPTDRDAVMDDTATTFPGFTVHEADGFYEGRSVATLVLQIATADTASVVRLAETVGRKLDQREVGLELNGLYRTITTA